MKEIPIKDKIKDIEFSKFSSGNSGVPIDGSGSSSPFKGVEVEWPPTNAFTAFGLRGSIKAVEMDMEKRRIIASITNKVDQILAKQMQISRDTILMQIHNIVIDEIK